MRRRHGMSAFCGGLIGCCLLGWGARTAPSAATYAYAVDAGAIAGEWSHFYEVGVDIDDPYQVLHSAYGRNVRNALRRGALEAGFRMVRGHDLLGAAINLYKEVNGNPVYDWARFDSIYDYIMSIGMRPFVELSYMVHALASGSPTIGWYDNLPGNITPPNDYAKWRSVITEIVRHCEARYGIDEVRNNWYFEVWNEPNLSDFFTGTQQDYFKMYDYASDGVALADSNCKVGGPTVTGKGLQWIDDFLNHVMSGTNLATGRKGSKVNFVTYHRYCDDDPSNAVSNPDLLVSYHRSVVDVVKKHGFTGKVMCTEWAPTWQPIAVHSELESAGSFVAKTIHMLNEDGAYPPPDFYSWFCLSDIFEQWNTGTTSAYNNLYGLFLRGDTATADSWDVAKPVFNVFKMLHMMGTRRLACTGGSFTASANAAATLAADGNSVRVLLYDHVNGGLADPTQTNTVNLTVNNIPFAPCSLRIEHFAVDVSHSNSYRSWVAAGSPGRPTAQVWARMKQASALEYKAPVTTVALTGKTYFLSCAMNTYGTSLVVLTNASSAASAAVLRRDDEAGEPPVRMKGGTLSVAAGGHAIRVFSAAGKLAAAFAGSGPSAYTVRADALPRGVCIVQARARGGQFVVRAVVNR